MSINKSNPYILSRLVSSKLKTFANANMRIIHVTIAFALFVLGRTAPFNFPLPNGFPSLNASALAAVEDQAGGTLTNMELPSYLLPDAVTAFQIVALSQFFEVAFFTSLLYNITVSSPWGHTFSRSCWYFHRTTSLAIRTCPTEILWLNL